MILIADSGSTKTSWVLTDADRKITGQCKTSGINPFYQTEEEIFNSLKDEFTLSLCGLDHLYFYGAGCANPKMKDVVLRVLKRIWKPDNIVVESDLVCAARSLCGHNPGIAAILGTGSNSCYYDGKNVVRHVSPLGFIMGDEGSGAILGKKLVADVLKRQLPDSICDLFFDSYHILPAEILDRVYKQPFPNRYLAQFTKFIHQHINEESLDLLVRSGFKEFFIRNISQYNLAEMPVNFTGSIAWYFLPQLKDAARETGYSIGLVTKDPLDGLVNYHSII